MKRKKWTGWRFLAQGEWSESPFHQGNETFNYTFTEDRRFWALMQRAFPCRILAVAEVEPAQGAEEVLGQMLKTLMNQGGPYIDVVHSHEEDALDFEELWKIASR